jgi:uncharacterized protein YjbJ (UPF0337 family)
MNWDRIEGRWKEFKGSFRQKWGDVTDDDLDRAKGKQEELSGVLQRRYGLARDEADRQLNEWRTSLEEDSPKTRTSGGY